MKKPRYKPGQHREYDEALTYFRGVSFLTNTSHMSSSTWAMASKQGLQGLLTESENKLAQVGGLLAGVAEAFENRKKKAKNEGNREPTELPPDLAAMTFRSEARFDVLQEEIDFVKAKIGGFVDQEKKVEDEKLLMYGPDGSGSLNNGILKEIDFQPVKADKEGVLRIDCKKSPYHGMAIPDYKEQVVMPFKKARREAISHALKMSRDLTLSEEERTAWFEKGRLHRTVSRENLPPRPEGF